MNLDAVFLAGATFVSTLIGGLLATRFRHRFGLLAAFAAGVLIAVPLFDLIPESLILAIDQTIKVEYVMYSTALGFIFLFILERYVSVHRVCTENECMNVRHPKGGFFGASELSAHSFIDGLAIGIGFQSGTHVGIVVAVAVISHDFSDGINTVTVMLNTGNSVRNSLKMLLLDATTPILGAASTLLFRLPGSYLPLVLPFFAGGFLYLGASDLLPEAHERNPPIVSVALGLAGFALIFVVSQILQI